MSKHRTHILRALRIIVAGLLFTGTTLLFLDFTGVTHKWLGWMAKIQFLPAVMSLNVAVIILLVSLTLLFGRVYCSIICPLGIMQDIVSWFRGRFKKKNRFRFSYRKENKWLRYGFLALFIAAMVAGVHAIVALLAPYSTYGRIVNNLFAPVYKWGNNLLAWISAKVGSYAFYPAEVWIGSLPVFIAAVAMFVLICILAYTGGRTWCNNICPVGTVLGLVSRYSLFGPVIDSGKCRGCKLCGKQCKSSCIDMEHHQIDYSRCVDCMDCLDICNEGAIQYGFRYGKKTTGNKNVQQTTGQMTGQMTGRMTEQTTGKTTGTGQMTGKSAGETGSAADGNGRRAFVISSALVLASTALKAQEQKVSKRLAPAGPHSRPEREISPVPAGAGSQKDFHTRCTACQLCVGACPNKVLTPSSSLENFMQPEMTFERGWCRNDCNRCSQVCPSGAIRPVSIEQKSSIQVGYAVADHERCVVVTDSVRCGNCAKHCPVGAIKMVPLNADDPKSLRVPSVNEQVCIGCGACEHLCPARPLAAIHVEGLDVHRTI